MHIAIYHVKGHEHVKGQPLTVQNAHPYTLGTHVERTKEILLTLRSMWHENRIWYLTLQRFDFIRDSSCRQGRADKLQRAKAQLVCYAKR